nr:hypothetical protein [uncultured Brevundimonas sp.]
MTTTGLSLTVMVLHFVGMAAITVVPDPAVLHDRGLSPTAMGVLVGVVLVADVRCRRRIERHGLCRPIHRPAPHPRGGGRHAGRPGLL